VTVQLTYAYAQISTQSVAELLAEHYQLTQPIHCSFHYAGLHDSYRITSGTQQYIFRIYRSSWRSPEEIDFELNLLDHLASKTSQVAAACRTQRGGLSISFPSADGTRLAALFRFAPGGAPGNAITPEQSALLGRSVAEIHRLVRDFQCDALRPRLELPYLLDTSVHACVPYLSSEQRRYLTQLQTKLHAGIPVLPREPDVYGICTGDVNPTNFHVNDNQELTLFDFDQCGYGFRAFEIAKYFSSLTALPTKSELTKTFLDGYQQIRQLTAQELATIPYFEIIALIWVMAIHVYNVDRIGHRFLEAPLWTQRLKRLQLLEEQLSS